MKNKKPTCAECEYFLESKDTPCYGSCAKNPPTLHIVVIPLPSPEHGGNLFPTARDISAWPGVQSSQWCGEWKKAFQLISH